MNRKVIILYLLALCLGMIAGSAFAAPMEMITNPGFENGSGAAAPPWYNSVVAGECNGSAVSGTPGATGTHSGSRMWQMSGAALNTYDTCEGLLTFAPGGGYFKFSTWIRIPSASPSSQVSMDFKVYFGTTASMYMDTYYSQGGAGAIKITSPAWVKITDGTPLGLLASAPTTQAFYRIRVKSLDPSMLVYVDDASAATERHNVTGKVVDSISAAGVAGIKVYYGTSNSPASPDPYVTTDASGGYTLTVPDNTIMYATAAASASYSKSATPVVIASGTTAQTLANLVVIKNNLITGTVKEGIVGLAGITVAATDNAIPGSPLFYSNVTLADGIYSISLPNAPGGDGYALSIYSGLPLGKKALSGPVGGIKPPATAQNFVVGADPDYDADLLFSAKSSDITTGPWPVRCPSGGSLIPINTPTTAFIRGQKWEVNQCGAGHDDGYRFPGPVTSGFATGGFIDPIAVNGASIVVALIPIRIGSNDNWQSVVDIFFDRLCLLTRNRDGRIGVKRNSNWTTDWAPSGTEIPNGQITVLSLVVQANGAYKVFANGLQVMDIAGQGVNSFLALRPNHDGSQPGVGDWYWDDESNHYINIGRNNGNEWTAFNGNIGDVYVYKTAIADTRRSALEASLAAKFGVGLPAKIYGINNKSALTDDLLIGKNVKVWGKVKTVSGDISFTISDGYTTNLTVYGYTPGSSIGKMAVVTGMRNANKSITASSIAIIP